MLERLFDLSNVPFRNSIFRSVLPWEWLNEVIGFLNKKSLSMPWDVQELGSGIFVDPECSIHPTAIIEGPCYISKNVEIGPFCLIREGCLLLDACHLGHCVEVKHSILMPGATCGHRNYIGDSVIGRNVNFGDGSSIANMRADHDPDKTIQVEWNGKYCGFIFRV